MNFPPPLSLSVIGVVDPGVPNRERVVLRPSDTINTAAYGVMIGIHQPAGHVIPLRDSLFWFGEVTIRPPSWIVLFTKPGQYGVTKHVDGNPVHSFFWHRQHTVFNSNVVVPVVFEMGALSIGSHIERKAIPD